MTRNRLLFLVVASILSVGCRTYESISPGEIAEGDFVRIVTWEGEVVKFKVLYVLPDTVVGKHEEVALQDIKSVGASTSANWGSREDTTAKFGLVVVIVSALFLVSFPLWFTL